MVLFAGLLAIAVIDGWLARQFDPSSFLVDEEERAAHDEVIAYMKQRRNGALANQESHRHEG